MTIIGLDVIVVSAEGCEISSTEFYLRFGSSNALDEAALASFGLHKSGLPEQSSTAFGIHQHASLQPEWVEFTVNGEICSDIPAFVGPHELVMFLDDAGTSYSQVPSIAIFRKFGLHLGCNHAVCNHRSSRTTVEFDIWLYDVNNKLVVMDIDGTITKSDVRGYLSTFVMGQYDYIHRGLVPFLNILTEHMNVNIMYLTARPITHSSQTKTFLLNAKEGEQKLPRGPLFPFKHGSLKALFQEVIAKTTVAFKSGVLLSVLDAFKTSASVGGRRLKQLPFFMGIGNKESDALAYNIAGIPPERILIIDKSSKIGVWRGTGKPTPDTLSVALNSTPWIASPRRTAMDDSGLKNEKPEQLQRTRSADGAQSESDTVSIAAAVSAATTTTTATITTTTNGGSRREGLVGCRDDSFDRFPDTRVSGIDIKVGGGSGGREGQGARLRDFGSGGSARTNSNNNGSASGVSAQPLPVHDTSKQPLRPPAPPISVIHSAAAGVAGGGGAAGGGGGGQYRTAESFIDGLQFGGSQEEEEEEQLQILAKTTTRKFNSYSDPLLLQYVESIMTGGVGEHEEG